MAQTCRTVRQVKQGERLRRSQHTANSLLTPAEVEGYGPYKPLPPPKLLSTSTPTTEASAGACFTPPPYRMPPYPLYGEPSIPGSAASTAAAVTLGIDAPTGSVPQGLHTHSSKFPIEREVIITNGDKNSKIPILHDYKKRSKAAIAPDVPPKQLSAWTHANNGDSQNYPALQVHNAQGNLVRNGGGNEHMQCRATYHNAQDGGVYMYKEQSMAGMSTGAVPRTMWQGPPDARRTDNVPAGHQIENNGRGVQQQQQQQQQVVIETKEQCNAQQDGMKNTAMNKTYQTIRGIISSRFKGAKENDGDKQLGDGEFGLNNVTEELRKSTRQLTIDVQSPEERTITGILKKTPAETEIYGKPKTDGAYQRSDISIQQQHQYNQKQQLLLTQQQIMQKNKQMMQLQFQQNKFQTHQQYQMNAGAVSRVPQEDQILYNSATYGVPAQRPANRYGMQHNSDQSFLVMRHPQYGEIKVQSDINAEEMRHTEPRSPQQLERDCIRQKSFMEARKAAFQSHLSNEDSQQAESKLDGRHSEEAPAVRRGSYGNLIGGDSNGKSKSQDLEKDSDDGGFMSSTKIDETKGGGLPKNHAHSGNINSIEHEHRQMELRKLESGFAGNSRTQLEGEIGKIEGVYNIGERNERIELDTTENAEKVIDVTQRKIHPCSGTSSDYEKPGGGQSSSNADSGRGSAAYSSGRRPRPDDTSPEPSHAHEVQQLANFRHPAASNGRESDWVDNVESELRHILEPKLHDLSLHGSNLPIIASSTLSESISSMTPPLPPLSPGDGSTPNVTPRSSTRCKHSSSLPYGAKPEYGMDSYTKPGKGIIGPGVGASGSRWQSGLSKQRAASKKHDNLMLKGKHLYGLDLADVTSTTTRSVDLESMLDGQSDSDGDLSTTDARAIRKQLAGLETMYSEVLKLLGVKKYIGRYQPSDPRFNKRRYGSMSSLPSSSVSSRPIRDKRARAHEERKKVKDLRGINKRFQRLESHVVTLARSVAHLSSEMRTQHLMIQEMENIREEIAALRSQTTMATVRAQSIPRGLNGCSDMPSLANPSRVKKLTKFFGDEPPLLRLFLKSLGYEKYANAFDNERVGMVELPYLSEERLQKIGIPLGPRLRILQEAQISVCKDTTLCIV